MTLGDYYVVDIHIQGDKHIQDYSVTEYQVFCSVGQEKPEKLLPVHWLSRTTFKLWAFPGSYRLLGRLSSLPHARTMRQWHTVGKQRSCFNQQGL
jgi:hypothetical protein